MHAIPEGEFIRFPRTTLYIEDLSDIDAVFRKECARVVITTPGTEWESVDDLARLSNKPLLHELTFQGHDPYVRLEFRPFMIEIYLSDKRDTRQRGIESLLRGVVTRRASLFGSWQLNLITWALLGLGYLSLLALPRPWGAVALGAASFAAAATAVASFRSALRRYSSIHLVLAASRVGFWTRSRDGLLVALIAALAGAAVTLVGTIAWGLFR